MKESRLLGSTFAGRAIIAARFTAAILVPGLAWDGPTVFSVPSLKSFSGKVTYLISSASPEQAGIATDLSVFKHQEHPDF